MIPPECDRNQLIKNILTVKNSIVEHDKLIKSENEIQRGILERLWVLSQRYSILQKGAPTKLHLPSEDPNTEIKAEFLSKLSTLQDSKLATSLSAVQNSNDVLKRMLDEFKAEQLELLDKENILQLPFASYIEFLDDFIKFYTKSQSQMNCLALLLRPEAVLSIERYKQILKPNKDFNEYFNRSLAMFHSLKKTS